MLFLSSRTPRGTARWAVELEEPRESNGKIMWGWRWGGPGKGEEWGVIP